MAATIGTTPDMMDSSRKRKPDWANVEPMASWMRAPAESMSQTIGMRLLSAISRARLHLTSAVRPMEPAITVKSYAISDAGRPLILPKPVTTPSAGVSQPFKVGALLRLERVPGRPQRGKRRELSARHLGRRVAPEALEPEPVGAVDMPEHARQGWKAPVRPHVPRPRLRPETVRHVEEPTVRPAVIAVQLSDQLDAHRASPTSIRRPQSFGWR